MGGNLHVTIFYTKLLLLTKHIYLPVFQECETMVFLHLSCDYMWPGKLHWEVEHE